MGVFASNIQREHILKLMNYSYLRDKRKGRTRDKHRCFDNQWQYIELMPYIFIINLYYKDKK